MTKLRAPGSIEEGLTQVFAILGNDRVATVTGKSLSLARAWADPDNDSNHIPLFQAVALDRACLGAGQTPPLLTAYKLLVGGARSGGRLDPMTRLADVMAEVGDLASEVRHAEAGESPGGRGITPEEGRAILAEVQGLRVLLDALEQDVLTLTPGA